jgi:hypothetical protein
VNLVGFEFSWLVGWLDLGGWVVGWLNLVGWI